MGSTSATYQQVTQVPVSLKVELTPHVGKDTSVLFDLVVEDTTLGERDDVLNAFTTNTRKVELNKLVARDGQPVVLGGLVRDEDSITEGRVPGLGSIPLLGWLFKHRKRERKKSNLLMVLVPHIIESPDDARRVHARRLRERLEFLERETAFERRDLDTHVNYRKKSGLLATIDAASRRQAHDAQLVKKAHDELERERIDAVVELGPDAP